MRQLNVECGVGGACWLLRAGCGHRPADLSDLCLWATSRTYVPLARWPGTEHLMGKMASLNTKLHAHSHTAPSLQQVAGFTSVPWWNKTSCFPGSRSRGRGRGRSRGRSRGRGRGLGDHGLLCAIDSCNMSLPKLHEVQASRDYKSEE